MMGFFDFIECLEKLTTFQDQLKRVGQKHDGIEKGNEFTSDAKIASGQPV